MLTDAEQRINELIDEMRIHNAILIMGAGSSFEAGMPLYAQFYPIVWNVLDSHSALKVKMGFDPLVSAKSQMPENPATLKTFFAFLESDSMALQEFKRIFGEVNNRHSQALSHVHLCISKLIHSGLIKLVISLNWDDLLETAWEKLYGTDINSNEIQLIKPHGSVRKSYENWTFPNGDGKITNSELEIIKEAQDNTPTTVVIVGYSESDRVIVEKVISPCDSRYKVFRISPNATDSISLKTSEAFKLLEEHLKPKNNNSYWEQIDYSNQVGLEHAIMGYRLLPSDVSACARLPQISDIKLRLNQAHSAIIKGEPGCGKSITAYQVAHDFLHLGWEVVKLIKLDSDIALNNNGYKTIYILDDAQQYEEHLINNLLGKANKYNKVIVTQTISERNSSESVVITQSEAVKAIYDHYIRNADEVIEIIREPNKRIGREVGNMHMQTPLKFILEIAKEEASPWLFNYSLRGGWAETRSQYNIAKEHASSHLLLSIISLYQILLLDKSVPISFLYSAAKKFGFNNDWVNSTLNYLFNEKMILDKEEIRVLHLQYAIRILVRHTVEIRNNREDSFYILIREEITSATTSLKGVYWLFDLFFSYDIYSTFAHTALNDEIKRKLLEHCLSKRSPTDIAHAAFVIDRVLNRNGLKYRNLVCDHGDVLRGWLNDVNNITAYALSNIINNMINEDGKAKDVFIRSLNRNSIVNNLKNLDQSSLYGWGHFLDRLAACQKKKWRHDFYMLLPKLEIHQALLSVNKDYISSAVELLSSLMNYNEEYAHEEATSVLHDIKDIFTSHFSDVLEQLGFEFRMYFLGYDLFEYKKPSKLQIKTSELFVAIISEQMISNCIQNGTPRDWYTLCNFADSIQQYDIKKWNAAINKIDLLKLNIKVGDLWSTQPDELLSLLLMLQNRKEDVDNWIYDNRDNIICIGALTITLSPKTAEYLFKKKKTVKIIDTSHHWWDVNANALKALWKYNKHVCHAIIDYNDIDIRNSLLELKPFYWDDYHIFFSRLVKVYNEYAKTMLENLDCNLLREKWTDAIASDTPRYYSRKKKNVRGFRNLIQIIRNNSGNEQLLNTLREIESVLESILVEQDNGG
ncbi:MAG: hypothetical protein FWF10_04900 [Clostridiales bacterium]|nr:hypothetical protein [Clostridiales bacterium]